LVGVRQRSDFVYDVKIPAADARGAVVSLQGPDDVASGVAQSPIVRVGIEADRGLGRVLVELAFDPEVAFLVEGEEGLVGRAGGRGAFDVEEDRGGLSPDGSDRKKELGTGRGSQAAKQRHENSKNHGRRGIHGSWSPVPRRLCGALVLLALSWSGPFVYRRLELEWAGLAAVGKRGLET